MCSCFSIGYFLDNNDMYHLIKCNLLSVVCRSRNHNIDAGFVYYKSFNVTYSLSTDTWICIYLIVVNKHILFYLAALNNKINTFYMHYYIQYVILIVFLFLIWQGNKYTCISLWVKKPCISKERWHYSLIQKLTPILSTHEWIQMSCTQTILGIVSI